MDLKKRKRKYFVKATNKRTNNRTKSTMSLYNTYNYYIYYNYYIQ